MKQIKVTLTIDYDENNPNMKGKVKELRQGMECIAPQTWGEMEHFGITRWDVTVEDNEIQTNFPGPTTL